MPSVQNAIAYLGFNITNVVFERPQGFDKGEFVFTMEHIVNVQSDDKNLFQVVFIVSVVEKEKIFNLQVQAVADFKIIGEVTGDIYNSFLKINAPAIAYPYLRSFISTIVIQAGMSNIILPPLNFAQYQLIEKTD